MARVIDSLRLHVRIPGGLDGGPQSVHVFRFQHTTMLPFVRFEAFEHVREVTHKIIEGHAILKIGAETKELLGHPTHIRDE
jgi:hypothetical protein